MQICKFLLMIFINARFISVYGWQHGILLHCTWQILNIAEEINQCLLVHDRLHAQIFICICFFIEPVLLLTFQIKKIFPVDVIKNPFQCSDAGLIKLMALLEGKKKFNHCFDNLTHMHQNNSTYYDSLNAFVRLQSSEIYMYYAIF